MILDTCAAVSMPTILETRSLSKHFGGVSAVKDLSLKVGQGELRCIIGPNGAGKSTFFRLVSGVVQADSGAVFFEGKDISRLSTHNRAHLGIGVKFQNMDVYLDLSVRHNLLIPMQHIHDRGTIDERIADLLSTLHLAGTEDRVVSELSHGERQWLAIGMAVAMRPKLLLLDEPTAGMGPVETDATSELIKGLNSQGMTILVVDHDMAFVRQLDVPITVLHFGTLFAQGTLREIEQHAEVRRIYLGSAGSGQVARQSRMAISSEEARGASGAAAGVGRPNTLVPDHAKIPNAMLALEDLSSGYGGIPIVRRMSFSVGTGEAVAIVGRNGVGKTTLVRTIARLRPIMNGTIKFKAKDIAGVDPSGVARMGLGYAPQGRGIFSRLTVAENLRMGQSVGHGKPPYHDERVFEWFPVLKRRLKQLAGTLSGGEQQMLSIGRLLVGNPDFLLLDEPSEGVQPSIVEAIAEVVVRHSETTGMAVLLVEQNLDLVSMIAERCLVMENGAVTATLSPDDLLDPAVAQKYLAV